MTAEFSHYAGFKHTYHVGVFDRLNPFCPICGLFSPGAVCGRCMEELRSEIALEDFPAHAMSSDGAGAGFRVTAVSLYHGITEEAVRAMKFRGERKLCTAFSILLDEALAKIGADAENALFFSIPSSRGGFRDRGFNPVAEILKLSGVDWTDAICLGKSNVRKTQKQLDRAGRLKASRGKFSLDGELLSRIHGGYSSFVIVDDVWTTGATVTAAASLLAGFLSTNGIRKELSAVVLAKAESLLAI